ncbi:hypothetical protein V8C42DRAFT_113945 [Trichoderma barbatum]
MSSSRLHLAHTHTRMLTHPSRHHRGSNIKIRLAHLAQSLPTSTNASVSPQASPSSRLPDVACSRSSCTVYGHPGWRATGKSCQYCTRTQKKKKKDKRLLVPVIRFPPLLLWHVPVVTVVRLLHNRWREDPMLCLLVLQSMLFGCDRAMLGGILGGYLHAETESLPMYISTEIWISWESSRGGTDESMQKAQLHSKCNQPRQGCTMSPMPSAHSSKCASPSIHPAILLSLSFTLPRISCFLRLATKAAAAAAAPPSAFCKPRSSFFFYKYL